MFMQSCLNMDDYDKNLQAYIDSLASTNLTAGDVTTYTVNGVTFKMIYVPGKTTYTGPADAAQATVGNDFQVAETEVTYELWNVVYTWAISNGYTFANAGTMGDGGGDTNQHPVTIVNWRDAIVWCNALTEYYNFLNATSIEVVYTSDAGYATPIRSSADGAFDQSTDYPNSGSFDDPYVNPNTSGFRLPTSNEWELAGRYKNDANSDGDIIDVGEYYPGNYASGATADYTDQAATDLVSVNNNNAGFSTAAVKSKNANALGLYDMSGNVIEWVFDWHPSFIGSLRVTRSGSWFNDALNMRVGYMTGNNSYYESSGIGFRLSRTH